MFMYTTTLYLSMAEGTEDFYNILELSRHSTANDIKRNYQKLIKLYHPDKLAPDVHQSERDAATQRYHKISQAYSVLSDGKKKSDYDTKLNAESLTQKWPVSDVVDLDDMNFDPKTGCYQLPCRCSGQYAVGEADLEEGVELVCCSMCSLSIKLLYQEQ